MKHGGTVPGTQEGKSHFGPRKQHEGKTKIQTKRPFGIQLELFGFSKATWSWQHKCVRPCFVFYILENLMAFLSTVDIIIEIGKHDWCLSKGHRVQFFMQVLIRVSGKTLQIYFIEHTMTQRVIHDSCCNKALCGLTKLKFSSHSEFDWVQQWLWAALLHTGTHRSVFLPYVVCSIIPLHSYHVDEERIHREIIPRHLITSAGSDTTCCLHFRNHLQSNKWPTLLPRRLENVCKHIGIDEH